jgi:hypothetical protein
LREGLGDPALTLLCRGVCQDQYSRTRRDVQRGSRAGCYSVVRHEARGDHFTGSHLGPIILGVGRFSDQASSGLVPVSRTWIRRVCVLLSIHRYPLNFWASSSARGVPLLHRRLSHVWRFGSGLWRWSLRGGRSVAAGGGTHRLGIRGGRPVRAGRGEPVGSHDAGAGTGPSGPRVFCAC